MLEKEIVRIKDHLVTIPRATSFNPLVPKQLNALFNLANAGFDYIILDAPCSGSGIQRRHPEYHGQRPGRISDIGDNAVKTLRCMLANFEK